MNVSPDHLWLSQALMVSLALGLAVSLFVGLLLLWRPATLFGLNARLSRWIDTRSALQALEQPLSLERFFYRHHQVVGGLITLAAAFVLWRWAFAYSRTGYLAALGRYWTVNRLDWIIAGLEWALVLLHAAILLFGLIVVFRPSLLKRVEGVANRWHRPDAEVLDAVVFDLEGLVRASPRLTGFIVSLGASWSLIVLLPVLVQLLKR